MAEFVTLERLKAALSITDGEDDARLLPCVEHGNVSVSTEVSAVADIAQVEAGGPLHRMAELVATDRALAFWYERQNWMPLAKATSERAKAGMEALMARIRADRPDSTETVISTRGLSSGLTLFDPTGAAHVTLAVG